MKNAACLAAGHAGRQLPTVSSRTTGRDCSHSWPVTCERCLLRSCWPSQGSQFHGTDGWDFSWAKSGASKGAKHRAAGIVPLEGKRSAQRRRRGETGTGRSKQAIGLMQAIGVKSLIVTSYREDLRALAEDACKDAGFQSLPTQAGLSAADWKPMTAFGPGAMEICIRRQGAGRVIYVARVSAAKCLLILALRRKMPQFLPRRQCL